jgi:hypothetical protein
MGLKAEIKQSRGLSFLEGKRGEPDSFVFSTF